MAKGSGNGRSKLTEDDVQSIRFYLFTGLKGQSELAKEYGVTRWVIRDVFQRKTWKHVETFNLDTVFVDRDKK
ncbi:MAG: hypothetical protein O3B41_08555 [Bacteroidetes bacterium]|nr:hypothetical protein [Bacteroidota bacterium]